MRANLEGADLNWAIIKGTNLLESHLAWTNFIGAKREGADIMKVNLEWANLRWANLRWANLRWANLEGANFSEEVHYLTFEQLSKAKTLQGAELDKELFLQLKTIIFFSKKPAKEQRVINFTTWLIIFVCCLMIYA